MKLSTTKYSCAAGALRKHDVSKVWGERMCLYIEEIDCPVGKGKQRDTEGKRGANYYCIESLSRMSSPNLLMK